MVYQLLLITVLLSIMPIHCQEPALYSDNDAQILILGGGRGGLQAARILLDNGISDFIILEGASEPQGLLKVIDFAGLQLEAGTPWAYPPSKSPLDNLNIEYHESDYESYVVRDDSGQDVTEAFDDIFERYEASKEVVDSIARESLADKRLDIAQKVALCVGGWKGHEPIEGAVEWFEIDFEYGKPSEDVSIVGPYEQDFGSDAQYYITDRKGGIFRSVLESLDDDHLRLNQVVQLIDQSGDRVVVTTEDGTRYTADYVLVTFNVGVLQRSNVNFYPELPPWKTEQICRFQRGTLDPIFLKFPIKFWEDEEWLIHAGSEPGHYPVFMNAEADGLYPAGTNILIGFVTGDEAIRVEGLRDAEVVSEILVVLRNMYGGDNVPIPIEFRMERWGTNPFHYGTQSTWPIPANVPADAPSRLRAHVGRIFFANDATHDQFLGTTAGNLLSSEIAISKIIGCLAGEDCTAYQPRDGDKQKEELYGCVKILKKAGKTRKETENPPENIEIQLP